jgi:hypothetical protein
MGAEALDREGTGDADLPLVLVGLVVEVLELSLRGDGGVDLFLPGDARLPPLRVQFRRGFRPRVGRSLRQSLNRVITFQIVINCLEPICNLRGVSFSSKFLLRF